MIVGKQAAIIVKYRSIFKKNAELRIKLFFLDIFVGRLYLSLLNFVVEICCKFPGALMDKFVFGGTDAISDKIVADD